MGEKDSTRKYDDYSASKATNDAHVPRAMDELIDQTVVLYIFFEHTYRGRQSELTAEFEIATSCRGDCCM